MFFKKKEDTTHNEYEINTNENNTLEGNEEKTDKTEEEWIWVEGYKGTDKDMKCRDMQYELNKTYEHEGKIELCESGFHFCKELSNVFGYYSLDNGNRFFKVKCLVIKDKWESDDNKFTAKEIIFTEELGYKELEKFIIKKYSFVHNKNEWHELSEIGIKKFYRKYFMSIMSDAGYGETFSNILYDDINKKIEEIESENKRRYIEANSYSNIYYSNQYISKPVRNPFYIYEPSYDYTRFDELINKVKAFQEEGLSKDMSVYLLLKR
jgi:hypothetical protein